MDWVPIVRVKNYGPLVSRVNLLYFTKGFALDTSDFNNICSTQFMLIHQASQLHYVTTNSRSYKWFQKLRWIFPLAFHNPGLIYYVGFVCEREFFWITAISCLNKLFLSFVHKLLKIGDVFQEAYQLASLAPSLPLLLIVDHVSYEFFEAVFVCLLEYLNFHWIHSL